MASIGREGERGELKRLIFRDSAGKQQSLRLGECSERAAEQALAGFERVHQAKRQGSTMHPDGVKWLEGIDDRIYARVVKFGLTEPRQGAPVVTLGMLLERFDALAAVKPATRAAYRQTTGSLRSHLQEATPVLTITPADADKWRKTIAEPARVKGADGKEVMRRLAPATVAKRVHVARSIFKRAVRWGMIPASPFADLRAGSQANPDRAFYVTRESIRAILEECPDSQWRAVVALSRYAGLRCPSEVTLLRWADVNWERLRLTVRSPKTAGHEGHAARVVPIVAELQPILQDLFDQAETGTEAVIPRLSDASMNLRTTFTKIVAKAGVKPWPRLFHNMRASCAMDWVERFPSHVVAGWLGHSPLIAAQHYLHTRDFHFDLATGKFDAPKQAAAIPATHTSKSDHTDEQAKTQNPTNHAGLVGLGVVCDPVRIARMGEVGFEPTKAKPTDLQSVLVDHLSIRPDEPKKLNEILNVRV